MIGERIDEAGFISEYTYCPDTGMFDRISFPVTGFFAQMQGNPKTMMLYDSHTRFIHPMNRVSIAQSVANSKEGVKKFPRPFILDYANADERKIGQIGTKIISKGDTVLIMYAEGMIYKPVVIASIEALGVPMQKAFLRYDPNNLDRQVARFETDGYILEFESDGAGEIKLVVTAQNKGTGNITIDLTGTDGNGNVIVKSTGGMALQQKDGSGNPIQSLSIKSGGGIKLQSKTSSEEYAALGESLKSWLLSLVDAIMQITYTSPGGPVTISSLPQVPIEQVKLQIDEILAK